MLHRPSERAERIMLIGMALVFFALFGAEIARDYTPAKMTALFCVLFWFPLLVVHELGHALVAHAFGCHVHQVSLGFGRPLWVFFVGRTEVLVCRLPIEGFIRFAPGDRELSRGKHALVYFAGPGAELLLAALVLVVVGPERLLSRSEHLGMLALQSLCISAVMGAVLNLIPHMSRAGLDARTDGERPTPNDGLGILLSLFGRR